MSTEQAKRLPAGHRGGAVSRRRVSMADVAERAGLSAQTVSRVSNAYPGVDPATREQVLAAMRELGYRPNSAARALKSGSFRTIGVIMSDLGSTGNMRTLEAINAASIAAGYAVTLLAPIPAQQADGGFSRAGESVVDAVIVVMERHQLDKNAVVLPTGLPVVVVDTDLAHAHHVVDTDQTAGSRSAVQHLLDLDHRNVWHVSGPSESFAAQRRKDAWRTLLEERGLEPPLALEGNWTAASGYAAGLDLAKQHECTAVFVANDQMALGVMRALTESGRSVPHDVSVVGFDDVSEANCYQPPLTTVHQDFAEVGRRCVSVVLEMLESDPAVGHVDALDLVPTRLIVRESTAPSSVNRSRSMSGDARRWSGGAARG